MADQEGDSLEIWCCEMHTLPVADVFSKEKRSWVMSRITGKDTKPELLLRSMLHRRGFRFTVNGPKNKKLPGRPLLGICFWRKVREERIWAEYMGVGFIPDNYQTSGIKLLEICEKFITV